LGRKGSFLNEKRKEKNEKRLRQRLRRREDKKGRKVEGQEGGTPKKKGLSTNS